MRITRRGLLYAAAAAVAASQFNRIAQMVSPDPRKQEILKFCDYARQELKGLLPEIKVLFAPEPEAVDYYDNTNALVHREYSRRHETLSHYAGIRQRLEAGGYGEVKFGIPRGIGAGYRQSTGEMVISEADGLMLLEAGHEFIHPALAPAYQNATPAAREQVRSLDEAFADTLGAICLVDQYRNESELSGANLNMYANACRAGASSVVLSSGTLDIHAKAGNGLEIALKIAESPFPLRQRILLAREELTAQLRPR
jgi:hypothetical protein